MMKRQSGHIRLQALARLMQIALLMACALFAGTAKAQPQESESQYPPLPVNPAPLSELMSAQEMAQLKKADSPKEQIETYLKLSDAHLDTALNAIKNRNRLQQQSLSSIFTTRYWQQQRKPPSQTRKTEEN